MAFWQKHPTPAPAATSISRNVHLQSYLNHHVLKPSTRKVSQGKVHNFSVRCRVENILVCVSIYNTNFEPFPSLSILNTYVLDDELITDGTTYDTLFQTTNGFALILRVYLPIDNNRAPSMTLHGVRASHNWLDIRMKVRKDRVRYDLVYWCVVMCRVEM